MTLSEERLLELEETALAMRREIIESIYAAGSGHPGGSLGITDVLTCLYWEVMRVDPQNPGWDKRDRLIMSKGHCCPALYAALALKGFFPAEELKTLRRIDSRLQGHPDMRKTPGVEFNGGSEGQGLSGAVGMALAAKIDGSGHRVYCIIGDGECQAGQIWEAAGTASHYRLDNLVGILDRNGLQIDGPTEEILSIEPVAERWKAFGWYVIEVDGHNIPEILEALQKARRITGRPTMIIAHTVKGKGVSYMEGTLSFHGKAPSKEEYVKALTELELTSRRLKKRRDEAEARQETAAAPAGGA